VLVLHGICFVLGGFLGQSKMGRSMKNAKFLSGTLHFSPFFFSFTIAYIVAVK